MIKFKIITLLSFIYFFGSGLAHSQNVSISSLSPSPSYNSGKVIASACFGDCGGSPQLMYLAKTDVHRGSAPYEVICTANTLCGNLSTMGRVWVNGLLVKTFDFTTPGSGTIFFAGPGDLILIEASPEDTDKNATCISDGSFSFNLIRK